MAALRRGLEVVLGCLAKCTAVKLSDFDIKIYVDKGNGSAGYVVKERARGPLLIEIFFGKDVYTDTPSISTELVANYLYATGKGISNHSALTTRMLAMIFHEFGHVFHQINSPSHYFVLGHLAILKDKGASEYGYAPKPTYVEPQSNIFNRSKMRRIANEQFQKDMDTWNNLSDYANRLVGRLKYFGGDGPAKILAFCKGVIPYTRKNMGTYASERMPEVVAEGFAAQVMGIPLGDALQELYETYGGLVPNDEMKLSVDAGFNLGELLDEFKQQMRS